jgi:hypothetical protein
LPEKSVNPLKPDSSCATCLYFQRQENGNGACHRYPPSFAGSDSPKDIHRWKFPLVTAHCWCGEYFAKPSA